MELEYNLIKIKTALKIYENLDPIIGTVRRLDERAAKRGHHSLGKDAVEYARELGLELMLTFPHFTCSTEDREEIPTQQIERALKQAQVNMPRREVEDQKWEGKLLVNRWKDEELQKACFI